MIVNIPQNIYKITKSLSEADEKVYLVGGSIRDYLLGTPCHDYDLAGSATPEKVIRLFPKVIPTGLKHGTVTIMIGNDGYEITTLRHDGVYQDGRHPSEVTFTTNIEEDLARRDFTINAMAYQLPEGPLYDPMGGQQDLAKKIIRAVGDPEKRFKEDGLRLLRAARFASKLGFQIDPETMAAMSKTCFMVDNVSKERISNELTGILLSDAPELGLKILGKVGIIDRLWPELAALTDEHLVSIKQLPPHLVLRLTQLLRPLPNRPDSLVKGLKLSNEISQKVLLLWSLLKEEVPQAAFSQRAFMAKHSSVIADYLQLVGPAGQPLVRRMATEEIITDKELAISSQDLMAALSLPAGPLLGKVRRYLLDKVWADLDLNNPKDLLNLARGEEWKN